MSWWFYGLEFVGREYREPQGKCEEGIRRAAKLARDEQWQQARLKLRGTIRQARLTYMKVWKVIHGEGVDSGRTGHTTTSST